YNVKDGLPSSEVYFVMQDSKGFMWFCTDGGACRFDGYKFTLFNKSNGLPDNNVFEAKEDYKGRIWFRTLSGKLCYYYNDSIHNLPINDTLTRMLSQAFTLSMFIDTNDNIYLGFRSFVAPLKISLRNKCSITYLPVKTTDYVGFYVCLLPSNGSIIGQFATNDSIYLLKKIPPLKLRLYNVNSNDDVTCIAANHIQFKGTQIHDKILRLPGGSLVSSFHSNLVVQDCQGRITFSKELSGEILDMLPYKNILWVIQTGNAPECLVNNEMVSH